MKGSVSKNAVSTTDLFHKSNTAFNFPVFVIQRGGNL